MNPFPTTGYFSPELFCDRKKETEALTEAILNGRNVMIFSLRRLGKSALIDHLAYKLRREKKAQIIHVDLLATNSLADFTNTVINAVLEFHRGKHPLKSLSENLMNSLLGSKIVLGMDALTGNPEISLEPGNTENAKTTLDSVLGLLAKSNQQIVLALDEFQQVCYYDETGVLAHIRSLTQTNPSIRFIYSGSEETLLTKLFTDSKQAFYKSAQLMQLKRISPLVYFEFAKKHFADGGFSEAQFNWIYSWCNGITFHVQWFCNRLFSAGLKSVTQKDIETTALRILEEFAFQFHAIERMLTKDQFKLLKAIGKENAVFKPTSAAFVNNHKLKMASHVQRSLKALLEKGLVQEDFDENNQRFYFISDVFLSRWLERY